MSRNRGEDLRGRRLSVAVKHRGENPRRPNTHGWLAFEVLRQSVGQSLPADEYERRLFSPSIRIAEMAREVRGARNAFQDLKHIRCDIYRGHVNVEPPLPSSWFQTVRCSSERARRPQSATRSRAG
jgi:hypothetical protein